MSKKPVRIEVTSEQLDVLRREVLCNHRLSGEQRRRAAKRILPFPADGSHVDLYFDGRLVGSV